MDLSWKPKHKIIFDLNYLIYEWIYKISSNGKLSGYFSTSTTLSYSGDRWRRWGVKTNKPSVHTFVSEDIKQIDIHFTLVNFYKTDSECKTNFEFFNCSVKICFIRLYYWSDWMIWCLPINFYGSGFFKNVFFFYTSILSQRRVLLLF